MKKKYILGLMTIILVIAFSIVSFGVISNDNYIEREKYIDTLKKVGYKNTQSTFYVTTHWKNGYVSYTDENGNTVRSTNYQISSYIPTGIPNSDSYNEFICLERIEPNSLEEQATYLMHYYYLGNQYTTNLMGVTYAYSLSYGEEIINPPTNQSVQGSIVNSTIPIFKQNQDQAILDYITSGVIDDNALYTDYLVYNYEIPTLADLNFNIFKNDNDNYLINVYYNSSTLIQDYVKIAFKWEIQGYTQKDGYFNLGNLERTNLQLGFDGRNEVFDFNDYRTNFLNANEYLDLILKYKCYSTNILSPNQFDRTIYEQIYIVRITNSGVYIKSGDSDEDFKPINSTSNVVGIGTPPTYENNSNTIISGINSIINGNLLAAAGSFFSYWPFELISVLGLGIIVVVCIGIIKAIRG